VLMSSLMLYTSMLGIAVMISQAAAVTLLVTIGSRGTEHVTQRLKRALDGALAPPASRDMAAPGGRQVLGFFIASLVVLGIYAPWLLSSWHTPHVVSRSELLRPGIFLVALKGIGDNSYPVAGLLLLGVVTGARGLRIHGARRCLLCFFGWAVAYIIAVWALDVSSGYYFSARQLVPAVPALLLLAGYGLSHVGERLTLLDHFPYRLSSPAQVYAAALLLMAIAVAYGRWRRDPADWAGTALYLRQTLRAGDVLSAPKIAPLMEYHAPSLRQFRSADLDPGPGTVPAGEVSRRFVVCYNGMSPDPCAGFRPAAEKGGAWMRRDLRGFTIFARE